MYGIECSEICGYCYDESKCFNVNGFCLIGCEVGYKGNLCKICKNVMLKYILN